MVWTNPRDWRKSELATKDMLNTYLRDNLTYLHDNLLPLGIIMKWSGAEVDIPDGWSLCDGSGGTEDLQDKFIIGAGGAYAPGDTGGADTSAPSGHSDHTVTQPNTHATHGLVVAFHGSQVQAATAGANAIIANSNAGHTGMSVDAHSDHSNFAVDVHSDHVVLDIRPPYYALAYIQRTSDPAGWNTPHTWLDEPTGATELQLELKDDVNWLLTNLMPAGIIAYWSRAIATIPTGWGLCDGLSGRLNLLDRAVPGAGSAYTIGDTGGGTVSQLAAHVAHVVTQPSAHADHVITPPINHTSTNVNTTGASGAIHTFTHTGWSADAHVAHALTVSAAAHFHTSFDSRPPFYALAFIQLQTQNEEWVAPRNWADGEIMTEAFLDTYLSGNLLALYNTLALGIVALWHSTIASIPSNWSLCNGTGGTPDMRGRIPFCAGLSYSPGITGGAATTIPGPHAAHVIVGPDHGLHVLTTNTHTITSTTTFTGGSNFPQNNTGQHTGIIDGSHPHTGMTLSAHSAHGSMSLLPAYKALAYIRRDS